ncbi:hypothetical protein KSP39_PZI000618 [Platanthera zijinensis]|uniref:Uncharacterized protein n=1 Tax=Platanthera zijinensis TaxID=2320716 RepID=A0AAP0C1B4_9ASPA
MRRAKYVIRKRSHGGSGGDSSSAPYSHPNYGHVAGSTDIKGDTLISWDDEKNVARLSSRLLSWTDDGVLNDDAYVLFGLYRRDDAEVLQEASPYYLADQHSRA